MALTQKPIFSIRVFLHDNLLKLFLVSERKEMTTVCTHSASKDFLFPRPLSS